MKETSYYSFLFKADKIEIKCKQIKTSAKDDIVVCLILSIFFAVVLLCGVFGIIFDKIMLSVLAFPLALCWPFFMYSQLVCEKKREKHFAFQINDVGISDKEINSIYKIKWEDVACWGFLNDNCLFAFKNRFDDKQMCMYFSKIEVKEKTIRRRCDLILNSFFKHKSSQNIIVLGFKENEIDKSIFDSITAFVNKRIASNKNQNYLKESNSQ